MKPYKLRTNIPLRNHTMINFIQKMKGDFFVRGEDVSNYGKKPSPYPEIYTTDEMAQELMERGFQLYNFGNLQSDYQRETDNKARRTARVHQNIVAGGVDGHTASLANPYLRKNRGASTLIEKYGCRRVTVINGHHRRMIFVDKKFYDPEIHYERPDDVNIEALIKQIKNGGARGRSRRDLVGLSRWFRTLDEMQVEDLHRKLLADGRVKTTKRTGRGGGNMVYISTRAVDLETII
ncbi:hypothetical protein LOKG_00009 [Loktanella phage pCB2051-A]|uniref:Uncharacterized protein n=1 Tax=Loktanella phage pCB2051-A TaxID=754044 RepID=M4QNX3_9CAUD|nr:hypothetical protein LOKG_00009 [Loktanella phage pCB2051-A]AGH31446.1 hypothetical protein LOKG_00009 [Loktanella phage pCB2051-A]